MNEDIRDILGYIKSYLELEKASGVEEYFFDTSAAPSPAIEGEDTRQGSVSTLSNSRRVDASSSAVDSEGPGSLESLCQEVSGCTACDLCKTRRNVVFGSGNPNASLMFIGEAPGEDEDKQGLPFVGRAGQLLTKIIEAMGLRREDVYIANILKCRPPNNRTPLPTEILACEDNVKRQVKLIKPKVICTLGKFASQTLLRTQVPISALRGKFQEYNGIKVMPTFHPAYLLRNPNDKKLVWEDMKKIKSLLK